MHYLVRQALRADWKPAMELAWRTFSEYDAADYTPEGIENFRQFLHDETLYQMFCTGSYRLFVSTLYGRIVGMLTLRERAHISLLFVDGTCHRNGMGSALVEMAAETVAGEQRGTCLTVHASPYALDFYRKLGFSETGVERIQEGVRYTPMILNLE